MTIYPVPKPSRGPAPEPQQKQRQPMKRTRIKQISAKRHGASFPKQRDRDYCRWVRERGCYFAGWGYPRLISPSDQWWPNMEGPGKGLWQHICWGPVDPAHVGAHRATGAPDFGAVLPMCRGAHQFYDEHRPEFLKALRLTERKLSSAAAGYALKYTERGGTP